MLSFETVSCQEKPSATRSGIGATALPATPGETADFLSRPTEQREAATMQLKRSAQAQAVGSSPSAIEAIAVALAGLGAAPLAGHAAAPSWRRSPGREQRLSSC